MSRHVYHNGLGEVHIYTALKGCNCAWCEAQREGAETEFARLSRKYSAAQIERSALAGPPGGEVETPGEDAGERLHQLALSKLSNRFKYTIDEYKAALAEARHENPTLTATYSSELPTLKSQRHRRSK
jgi:hypothetical protein